jgi:hypothetical protein
MYSIDTCIVTLPGFFFGIITLLFWDCYFTGFFFGIVTLLFWDCYCTWILFWDCYYPAPLICFGIITVLILDLITVLILDLRTVLDFRDYSGDPFLHQIV